MDLPSRLSLNIGRYGRPFEDIPSEAYSAYGELGVWLLLTLSVTDPPMDDPEDPFYWRMICRYTLSSSFPNPAKEICGGSLVVGSWPLLPLVQTEFGVIRFGKKGGGKKEQADRLGSASSTQRGTLLLQKVGRGPTLH